MNYNKKPDFQLALFMIAFLFVTAIGVITYKKPEKVQAYYETGSNYITNTNDKVKILAENTREKLENSINEFLKENIIISIDYEYCPGSFMGNFQALVHYKEKK